MINQDISLEPELQFSQRKTFFFQNYKGNSMILEDFIIYLQQGVWGTKTSFGHLSDLRIQP